MKWRKIEYPLKTFFVKFNNIFNLKSLFKEKNKGDLTFELVCAAIASSILIILALMFIMIIKEAWLSITTYGIEFIFGTEWIPYSLGNEKPVFSALPLIWGTLVTSTIALLISVPISLGVALALSEFSGKRFNYVVSALVELLAAIPSVVYGLWGIFILIPFLKSHVYPFLQQVFYFLPFFQGRIHAPSVMTGSIVLSIMILPTIAAVMRDVFSSVPKSQREAIISLGATRWETAKLVIQYSKIGVIGAIMLGLGRAVGETMAITMVIGNSFNLFTSLFEPGYTLSSIIANEFTEASSPPEYLSALMEIGLILLILALVINSIAQVVVRYYSKRVSR